MKRTPAITIITLIILFSTSCMLSAQKGDRIFIRGMKYGDEGKFIKAGNKLVKAYYKGYYPGFEALAYAAFCFSNEGYLSNSMLCVSEAENNAGSFIDGYMSKHQGISSNADATPWSDREVLYEGLFTIADTSRFWNELELITCLEYLVYVAAHNYLQTEVFDTAIYYANLGLKYQTDPDLFSIKGDAWLELDQADSSISAFSKVIELSPDDVSAYCGTGEALYSKNKNEAAMKYFDQALGIEPENTWALYCKASVLYEMYEYLDAINTYTEIIDLDPSYHICYYDRADVYFDLEEYQKAIDDYEKYLEFVPGDEDALYNLEAAEENLWNGY